MRKRYDAYDAYDAAITRNDENQGVMTRSRRTFIERGSLSKG